MVGGARVNTTKPFNSDAFKDIMKSAWRLAYDPNFREMEDNLLVIQRICLRDWNRVMHQGP